MTEPAEAVSGRRPPPTEDEIEAMLADIQERRTPAEQAQMDALEAQIQREAEERTERGKVVMQSAQRYWAAMQGWDRVQTQADWDALYAKAIDDWQSGAALLTMLGGQRFVEPERAALCVLLWQDFRQTYQPQNPAEDMVICMAVLSFDHFLRINGIVHNIQARIEGEMFGLGGMHTDRDPDPFSRSVRGLTVEGIVEQLGIGMLPLLDRLNRLVIRNLRTLRELKTAPLNLNVANFGQLNVGQTQTNVGKSEKPSKRQRRRTTAKAPSV
jgi:hypothetical protein